MNPFEKIQHSFQVRLFLALALIISIFIPGTGYFSYLQARKAVEKQMQHYSINTAAQIAERIRQFLSQHMDNARLIKAFLENSMIDVNDPMALINYFYLLKRDHPEFANVYYGDQHGNFIMVPPQTPDIHKVFDPRTRPWYEGAVTTGGAHWTNVYLFASTQKPGITASIPIYDDHRKAIGVSGIDIDLSTFSRFLRSIKIENQGYAYIIENQHGRVIAHPDLVQRSWEPQHIDLLSTCLTDLKAAGKQFGLTTFHNEYFFTAYTDYPDNDWTVGVTLPMTEFLRHIQSIKKTTITLVIIGMVLCFMLSYLLTLTIVRPLMALKQGIELVSCGNLDYTVDPPRLDIADALAHSFNQMAASLQKSQAELKRTYIELVEKEKMAALGQMTASIAHELKNPLGVILGSAQVVANVKRPLPMREEAARFIIDEIERLNKTLKAFLAFSKPASPSFSPANLVELLEETMAATEEQMNTKGIQVEKELTSEHDFCHADRDQIRQVFWNILINASQAMPDGGRMHIKAIYQAVEIQEEKTYAPVLRITPARELVIHISDSGCGIQPDQMDTIFEPFVSYRTDGIGLGLSIVYQIIKLHRAKIEVINNINQGTTFSLKFPCIDKHYEKSIQSTHR